MRKELRKALIDFIIALLLFILTIILVRDYLKDIEYIKELEQNQIEQAEEKEVYVNKCKMLEDLLKENGFTLDECECR